MLKIVLLLAIGFLLYQLLRAAWGNPASRIVGGERKSNVSQVPRDDIEDAEFSDCEPTPGEEERGQEG